MIFLRNDNGKISSIHNANHNKPIHDAIFDTCNNHESDKIMNV